MIIISGPCVIDDKTEQIAEHLSGLFERRKHFDFYFKASYDKANRTSISSYRGPGIQRGLEILANIKSKYGIKITTDVHTETEAVQAASVVDMIQIPALLCRQTDLLVAAGQCAKAVNIKKGQFMAPWDMVHAVEKVRLAGCKQILLTERGTSFGYNRLVVDMLSIPIMQKTIGEKVLVDCTHSLQLPGAGSGCSASQPREYALALALAATAAGADGLFFEVYDDPDKAACDGPNSISLKDVPDLINKVLQIKTVS